MASPQDTLRAAGIRLSEDVPAETRAEISLAAQAIARRGTRLVGLIPATPDVAIPAIAVPLAEALGATTGKVTGLVDPLGAWPTGSLAAGEELPSTAFTLTWLTGLVILFSGASPPPGAATRWLATLVKHRPRYVDYLVVDLSGFEARGEHLEALALLDGVAIVARAGRTRVPRLDRWMRDVEARRNLGVLLVGI